MATSLSKIKNQIKKLQQQAASLQSTVISRIKKEIAQHGLDIDDLFNSKSEAAAGKARPAQQKKATGARKSGADKPAKFADDQGNTWHGIGKRPQWIHDALAAGRTLDEFLVGKKKAAAKTVKAVAKTATKKATKKAVKKAVKKTASADKAAPAKNAAPAEKAAPAKKAAGKTAAKKTAAKKTTASKTTAKKAPTRKTAKSRAESSPASAPAEAS